MAQLIPQARKITDISTDDIFLASFPKSGNTWIRFFIANLYNEMERHFDEINFFNIHEIIPELSNVPGFQLFINFPKVFKTHQKNSIKFNKVILILRNPYDSLYSYFKYLNGENRLNISLNEVIHHKTYGIEAIIVHTNSYVNNCKNLHIVTYEKLYSNPYKYFKNICLYLKIKCTKDQIITAINKSSFQSLREIELSKGRKYGNKDFLFMRQGKVGEGLTKIDLEDRKYIDEIIKRSSITNRLYG